MAKIMIQGTMSNVGKSLIAAGLCRIFRQDGYRVAPFKSQNMALNSYITAENLEMGRAQAVQAEACGIEPEVCMNPILLKPTTDMGSQVIVGGKVIGDMRAADYFKKKKEFLPVIEDSYKKLADAYDIVVIEGAGSPAEINLKQDDIVNMGMAALANAPVLLVGDIDRGGVFAQLYGTLALLDKAERARVKGLIVNKFRGDKKILEPGLSMLEEKCRRKVFGVVPYLDVNIEEEDSLAESLAQKSVTAEADIAVIRFPKLSNFTDVLALSMESSVSVRYVSRAGELEEPDLILLPGTKNTIRDMKWLRESGLEAEIIRLARRGTAVFGICGGYQILGESIADACGAEGGGSIRGMGLLPVDTYFEPEKTRGRMEGYTGELKGFFGALSGKRVCGYEIHMGQSRVRDESLQAIYLNERWDGCCCGNVFGTYLHGIFDEADFREALIRLLCERKGISYENKSGMSFAEYKDRQYDKLAKGLRESLDMEEIYRVMEENERRPTITRERASLPRGFDLLPEEIEKRSFEILTTELGGVRLERDREPVIKRVIHTTADFDYLDNLCFSENAVTELQNALRRGACIVTDTQMARSGINKRELEKYGGEVYCFMSDEDVARAAKENKSTRAAASVNKAAGLKRDVIFAVGNAPTALIRLYELIQEGKLAPKGIIGTPVGFVNVVEAKELVMRLDVPYIVAKGRKGGSNVAAAICNALLYSL